MMVVKNPMDNADDIKIKGFTFFRSYYESLSALDPDSRLRIYDAIFAYAFDGITPQLSNIESVVFKLILPTLDTSIKKYINSVRNGRKCVSKDPSEPQTHPSNTPDTPQTVTGYRIQDSGSWSQDFGSNNQESGKVNKDTGFAPPSLQDVQAYIADNGLCVSADDFYNYYSSNGWHIKDTAMADWQAAIRSWHSRSSSAGKLPRRTDLDDIM